MSSSYLASFAIMIASISHEAGADDASRRCGMPIAVPARDAGAAQHDIIIPVIRIDWLAAPAIKPIINLYAPLYSNKGHHAWLYLSVEAMAEPNRPGHRRVARPHNHAMTSTSSNVDADARPRGPRRVRSSDIIIMRPGLMPSCDDSAPACPMNILMEQRQWAPTMAS